MESKKEFNRKVFRLASLNALNTISYEGTWRQIRKVRKNLLQDQPNLVFDLYNKVELNQTKR